MPTLKRTDRLAPLIQRAVEALGFDLRDTTLLTADRVQALSTELFLEWLLGDRRFESHSQQTEYWISRFYAEFYPEEQPDATRIYTRFNVPLSRASYLTRLLRAKGEATWREAARNELRKRLSERRKDAEQAKSDGTAHISNQDIALSSGAVDELVALYDAMCDSLPEGQRPKPPQRGPFFGRTRYLTITAETILALLEHLSKKDGKK